MQGSKLWRLFPLICPPAVLHKRFHKLRHLLHTLLQTLLPLPPSIALPTASSESLFYYHWHDHGASNGMSDKRCDHSHASRDSWSPREAICDVTWQIANQIESLWLSDESVVLHLCCYRSHEAPLFGDLCSHHLGWGGERLQQVALCVKCLEPAAAASKRNRWTRN